MRPQHVIAMKTVTDQLSQYASYHRDRRNLVTHLIGVPMIVVAVTTLLARPSLDLGGIALSPALVLGAITIGYYLLLDVRLGLAMLVLLGAAIATGQWLAAMPTIVWALAGVGLFAIGWVIQFIGHYYEGRKPAFVDDVIGLLIGPLFVVTEVAFMLGLRHELREAIERRVGPMRNGFDRASRRAS
jgi:uncharacterized membrane protein YGL010W